jgi:TfoX/Sxy family transcriptional regulator of competence genes
MTSTTRSRGAAFDQRFQAVVDAFAGDGEVSAGRMFASYGLKVNSKFFAFEKDGAMVVKLPKARVAELIASGSATPFLRGDTPMAEWTTVPAETTNWVALAREAHAFVRQPG